MSEFLDELEAAGRGNIARETLGDVAVPQTFDEAYEAYSRETVPAQKVVMGPGNIGTMHDIQVPAQTPTPANEGFYAGFQSAMIDDPQKRLQALSQSSGIPLDRMGYVQGSPVYVDKDGQFKALDEGNGAGFGTVMGHAPEIVGGVGGAFATPATPNLGGAGGAMTGLAIKKGIANLLWDDPIGIGDLGDLALEGALDFTGGKALQSAGKLLTKSGLKGLDNLDPKRLAVQKEYYKRTTGLDLDIAQLTGLPQLKLLKTWARNYPGSAHVIQAHQDLIEGQSDAAIKRLASAVANGKDPAAVGLKGVNAAKAAIGMAKAEADRWATPFYTTAFENAKRGQLEVDITPVIAQIDALAKGAKGPELKWLKEAKAALQQNTPTKVGDKMVKLPESQLQALHKSKRALDEMLARKVGDKPLTKDAYRDITMVKKHLMQVLGAASPEYAQAAKEFGRAQKALVEPLERSIVRVLADMPDHKAAKAAATLFTGGAAGGEMTPLAIGRAKRYFARLAETNPEHAGAWEDLTATWIRQTLNKASKETQAGNTNIAGNWLKAAFGTPDQQAVLKRAVGPDAYQTLADITKALRMASSTPTTGSHTAFMQEIGESMGEGAVSFFQRLLAPRKTALDALQRESMDKAADAVAIAMTDPSKMKKLSKLRAMKPSTERNLSILGLVFGSTILSGYEELTQDNPTGMSGNE